MYIITHPPEQVSDLEENNVIVLKQWNRILYVSWRTGVISGVNPFTATGLDLPKLG